MQYLNWYPLLWLSYDFILHQYGSLFGAYGQTTASGSDVLPDTMGCCRKNRIPDYCVEKLCDTSKPPDEFAVFEVASRCPKHLSIVSKCLSDGRNHRPCCERHSVNPTQDCLHLCDGTATSLNTSSWEEYKRYVACLTFNIRPIYQCMREGYNKGPSIPTNVRLIQVGPRTAKIQWGPPARHSDLVQQYRVTYIGINITGPSSPNPAPKLISAHKNSCVLTELHPDTNYNVFLEALGKDGFQSLRSEEVTVVTNGVAPTVKPHHSNVGASMDSIATLVCDVDVYGSAHLQGLSFVWEKRSNGRHGQYNFHVIQSSKALSQLPSDSKKYELVSYLVKPDSWNFARPVSGGQKHYVTALRIHNVNTNDFGQYRCVARNSFGENFSDVLLKRQRRFAAPTQPVNVTACCERQGVHPSCLNTCKSNAAEQGADGAKATQLKFRCAMDVPIVLKCSTDGMNYDSCCLSRRVPLRCLPFCDGSRDFPLRGSLYSCLLHTTDILSCHLEAKMPLPFPPSNIQVVSKSFAGLRLQWRQAQKASIYYVYYRNKKNDPSQGIDRDSRWYRKSTAVPRISITGFHSLTRLVEIVIISANEAGVSDSSKSITVTL